MAFFTGLVVGLIIGWVTAWIIDRFSWRPRQEEKIRAAQAEKQALQAKLEAAEADIATLKAQRDETIRERQAEKQALQAKLEMAQAEIDSLKAQAESIMEKKPAELPSAKVNSRVAEAESVVPESQPAEAAKPPETAREEADRLDRIRGIGKVIASRFYEAGVRTYADLAALNPERAWEISGIKARQTVNPESWIAQAKQLMSSTAEEQNEPSTTHL